MFLEVLKQGERYGRWFCGLNDSKKVKADALMLLVVLNF